MLELASAVECAVFAVFKWLVADGRFCSGPRSVRGIVAAAGGRFCICLRGARGRDVTASGSFGGTFRTVRAVVWSHVWPPLQ